MKIKLLAPNAENLVLVNPTFNVLLPECKHAAFVLDRRKTTLEKDPQH